MTKYVIVKCDDDKIWKPHIYSDEQYAYSFYADMILNELGEYIDIDDEDYTKYQNIFKTKDTNTIKKNLLKLIDKYNNKALDENDEYVVRDLINGGYFSEDGYYFGEGEYKAIIQIFKVNENTTQKTSDIISMSS